MKRFTTALFIVSMVIFLAACSGGGGDQQSQGKAKQDESTAQQQSQQNQSKTQQQSAQAESKEKAQSGQEEGGQNEQSEQSKGQVKLESKEDKFSYAVGMDIGSSLQPFAEHIETDKFMAGLGDSLHGKKTQLSGKEKTQIIQAYVKKIRAQREKKHKAEAKANAEKSKEFLAEKAKKKGVKTTDDGLEYKVLKEGSGKQPTDGDIVKVKYKGKLPDGGVFDSSYKRGKPATFPVNEVIPGWTEALKLMHVGGKYRLFIPPDLAYGKQGAGSKIGPNQVLIFDVHLVGIEKKQSKKAGDNTAEKSGEQSEESSAKGGDNANEQQKGSSDSSE